MSKRDTSGRSTPSASLIISLYGFALRGLKKRL
nr:MAG TPA: hypothetical protein [Caudoviricetes sp.]